MALISGTSKVEMVSQSFSLIGKPRPTLALDEDPTTSAASAIYDTLLQETFTSNAWRFALQTIELNQTTTPPENEFWRVQYQIPSSYLTMLRIYKNFTRGGFVDFQIFKDKIWTNETAPLFCDFIFDPGPGQYPAYFSQLLIFKLAALIALPVAQNENLALFWEKKAEAYFLLARNRDKITMPNLFIQKNNLFGSHFGL